MSWILLQESTSVALFLVFLPLLVPGHLDGFELAFVRLGRIVAEIVELGDPLVQVGEAHLERILLGKLVIESHGDVFRLVPGDSLHIRSWFRSGRRARRWSFC